MLWWLEVAAYGGELGDDSGQYGHHGSDPRTVGLARSTMACGATVVFSRQRR
jgi:hypothetical protein